MKPSSDSLRAAGIEKITVVLGHHAESHPARGEPRGGAQWWSTRITSGGKRLHCNWGLRRLAADAPEAVILCLVDHPAISSGVIAKLLERFEATRPPVLIPTYKGERGHPVVISQTLFPELLAATRRTTRQYGHSQIPRSDQFVEVADRGILLDVDDPETYERLERRGR